MAFGDDLRDEKTEAEMLVAAVRTHAPQVRVAVDLFGPDDPFAVRRPVQI